MYLSVYPSYLSFFLSFHLAASPTADDYNDMISFSGLEVSFQLEEEDEENYSGRSRQWNIANGAMLHMQGSADTDGFAALLHLALAPQVSWSANFFRAWYARKFS